MSLETVRHFLIALFIGALIGIEREQRRASRPSHYFGGVRTFILLALVGAIAAWLGRELALPWLFAVALAAVALTAAVARVRRDPDEGEAPEGPTSEIAALAVFLLGAMVVVGDGALGVALAVVICAVLALDHPLHGLVARMGAEDLLAALKLLSATFIVLPLLPRSAVDPWQAIVPYQLWLLVILTSALSLVGYVAVRWLGAGRGTAVMGIAGGLVSSTATTLRFARDSKAEGASADGARETTGILLSWMVMFIRVLALVAVVSIELLQAAWWPLLAMGTVTAVFAVTTYLRLPPDTVRDAPTLALRNPFRLGEAVRFGLLFAVVALAVRLAQTELSSAGLYLVSTLAGLADVDAIALSLAQATGRGVTAQHAAGALCLALAGNTAVKTATVFVFGAGGVRGKTALAGACILLAGGAVVLGTW